MKKVEDASKPAKENKEKLEKFRERLLALKKRTANYHLMLKQNKFPKYPYFVEADCDIRKFNVGLFTELEKPTAQHPIQKTFYIEPII